MAGKRSRILALAAFACCAFGVAQAQPYQLPNQVTPDARNARIAAQMLTVNCPSSSMSPLGDAVLCLAFADYTINSDGPGAQLALRLTAPSAHCAAVKYYIERANGARVGMTEWLNPNESGLLAIGNDLPRGAHRMRIWAWGRVGGCLTDRLTSWAVSVESVVLP